MGLVTANQQVSDQASFPTGAVLAGGQSARMGQPKAAVRLWDGRTMMEHMLDTLLASGLDNRYVVAACDQPLLSVMLLRRVAEGDTRRPHFFRAARISSILPLPAHLPVSLLEDVQRILASPDRSLRALMAAVPPQWIEISVEEEKLLTSVNTPAELAELNQRMLERSRAH
jgi:molybdopterin-guanine dinucleotide biosynthesis protein A